MSKKRLGSCVLCCVAVGAILASQALADYTTTYYSVTRGGSGTGLGYNSWSNCYYDVPHQAGSGVRFDFTIPVQSLTAWVWAGLEGNQPSSYLRVHFGDDSGEWGTEYYSGGGGMILWEFSKTAPSGREITWVRSESQNHVVDAYVNTKVMNLNFCDIDSDGDGMKNLDEIKTGTDPWDSNSVFVLDFYPTETNEIVYVVSWPGKTGKQYAFQTTDDALAEYQNVTSNIAGQYPTNSLMLDFTAYSTNACYRVVQTTDNIRSLNAVGYTKTSIERGQMALVSLDFESIDGDVLYLNDVVGGQVPPGSVAYFWNSASGTYQSETRMARGGTWLPNTNPINPGVGFWLGVSDAAPSNSYDVYLAGELPSDSDYEVLVRSNLNLVGKVYPVSVLWTNTQVAQLLPPASSVYLWRGTNYEIYSKSGRSGWPNPLSASIGPGEGFWVNNYGTAVTWSVSKPYTWP